ncbi:MAG TPA: sigma-70 family RNA polymerase sigma factor [Candidatus Eisenbacteria bacterium]|nr:sigma-70 family RNA polymerase sigma factor [Candidatus Eisenbacteria bacterium]
MASKFQSRSTPTPADAPLRITGELVERAKRGDRSALDTLMERYQPRLVRWASGRLPSYARSLLDTSDLVQETLIRTVERLVDIESQGPGAFEGYVRRAILNRIQDQVRWARRRPIGEVPETLTATAPSPLELAIGADLAQRYERALEQLPEEERHLIHLRIELDFDHGEIAAIVGRSSPDAARMAFQRALRKLADIMGREDDHR